MRLKERFNHFAYFITMNAGSPFAFVAAFGVVTAWVIGGFYVGFSNTNYQLLINTFTTIVTFLMVFLIQASQNRDSRALHLKIDELISSSEKARNLLLKVEDMSDEDVAKLKKGFDDMGS